MSFYSFTQIYFKNNLMICAKPDFCSPLRVNLVSLMLFLCAFMQHLGGKRIEWFNVTVLP